jgi:hypothetical protein
MHDRKDASVSKADAKRPRVLFIYCTYARRSLRVVESMAAVAWQRLRREWVADPSPQ